MTEERINEIVHKLYWEQDVNCAGTMLRCLGEAFQVKLDRQILTAAAGMHGAGGYRAQCGLVEGALLFIGIYCDLTGKDSGEAAKYCYEYAEAFTGRFGSLKCLDLRPGGFTEQDPPHLCERLTCEAVLFACEFIGNRMEGEPVADAGIWRPLLFCCLQKDLQRLTVWAGESELCSMYIQNLDTEGRVLRTG